MSFHPLGYNVHEQYPGQHPAEAVLDHIMATLRDHRADDETMVIEIARITQRYFDHKATLPKTPDYDKALAGPAMQQIRIMAHELVCGLIPKQGWPISLGDARSLAIAIDKQAQYLWPDIE